MALKRNFERILKAGIPDDQLVIFRMTPDEEKELSWVNHKEFIFHGEYYDIVSMISEAGIKEFRCISDKAEHEIEELAEEMAGRSEKNGTQKFPHLKYVPESTLIAVKSQFPFLIHRTCLIHQMKDHFHFQIHPQPPDMFSFQNLAQMTMSV